MKYTTTCDCFDTKTTIQNIMFTTQRGSWLSKNTLEGKIRRYPGLRPVVCLTHGQEFERAKRYVECFDCEGYISRSAPNGAIALAKHQGGVWTDTKTGLPL